MIKLSRILLPTDFSDFSSPATDYACEFADQFGAELHVLHVLEVYQSATPDFAMGLALPSRITEVQEHAEKELARLLEPEWAANHKVVTAITEGAPFLEIIQYAKREEVDLIVMGTHGRSGLVHVLLGSVAERVVRKAPCPVLTIRPEGHQFVMP